MSSPVMPGHGEFSNFTIPQNQQPTTSKRVQIACPVCSHGETICFFETREFPVHCCVLHDSSADALTAKTGQVSLCFCGNCEFVFNAGFEADKLDFQPGYDASLTFSDTFRDFSNEVADRLVEKYHLNGKSIVEVGCGEGYFSRLLAEKGGNHCVGFDPTIRQQVNLRADQGTVRLVRDFYDDQYKEMPCDFLCCLSVMEDLQDPNGFVQNLTSLFGDREVNCYFEIFNGIKAIENLHTWSILYEQCNYFSVASFAKLFSQNGFKILDSGTCYKDGEYLHVEAKWGGRPEQNGFEPINILKQNRIRTSSKIQDSVASFWQTHCNEISRWNDILDLYDLSGKRGVVWGTGGKGVSFLNSLRQHRAIVAAVDINPRRAGRFVPGSGHPIVHPDSLPDLGPDFVIVTNPLYEMEIHQKLDELGVDCDFFTT